jgi:hypothetical protein
MPTSNARGLTLGLVSNRLCLALFAAMLLSPLSHSQSTVSSITQHGITWRFSAPVQAGQYINGDYWVVGPVTIQSVSPGWNGGQHGSMLNPPSGGGAGRVQAYDSRIRNFDANLAARYPLKMHPGDSLVSTISVTGAQQKHIYRPSLQGIPSMAWLRTCAILTCVAKVPPTDSFRPPYCGPKHEYLLSQVDWNKLPGLPRVPSSPDPRSFARMFERPWLDHLEGWIGRMMHPAENMPDYGRDIALCVGEAALTLLQDFKKEELEPLMIGFLQLGIDLYGLAESGHNWRADGGHSNGRKWPIIFAGLMFNRQKMTETPGIFSEDQQTAYKPGWNGTPVVFDMYGHGSHEGTAPAQWNATESKAELYRRCCTSAVFVSHALAAHLMNATERWGDPTFFLYVERWMTPMHPSDHAAIKSAIGSNAETYRHGGTGTDVTREMWDRYRSFFQPRGVFALGRGSQQKFRLHLAGIPLRGHLYPMYIANAPQSFGILAFGSPSGALPGYPLPIYLSEPLLMIPFQANPSGKANFNLALPMQRGLVIGMQAYWFNGQGLDSSPGYAVIAQ